MVRQYIGKLHGVRGIGRTSTLHGSKVLATPVMGGFLIDAGGNMSGAPFWVEGVRQHIRLGGASCVFILFLESDLNIHPSESLGERIWANAWSPVIRRLQTADKMASRSGHLLN